MLSLAEKALKQIEEKDYISDLKKFNASPIYIYGMAFSDRKTKILSKEIK